MLPEYGQQLLFAARMRDLDALRLSLAHGVLSAEQARGRRTGGAARDALSRWLGGVLVAAGERLGGVSASKHGIA